MHRMLEKWGPVWAAEDEGGAGGEVPAEGAAEESSSVLGGNPPGETPPAEGEEGDGEGATPPEENEGEAEAPPPLSADDLEIPEGLTVTDEQRDGFLELLNDSELSPAQRASKLLEMQKNFQESQVQQWIDSQKARGKEILDDPEIGGDKWEKESAPLIHNVIEEFSDDPQAFMKELTESGMGNSIRMARLLVNVGKLVAEGKPVVGGPTSAQDLSLADKMFPNQGKS